MVFLVAIVLSLCLGVYKKSILSYLGDCKSQDGKDDQIQFNNIHEFKWVRNDKNG